MIMAFKSMINSHYLQFRAVKKNKIFPIFFYFILIILFFIFIDQYSMFRVFNISRINIYYELSIV
jgi:hypothetical protein